jgi:hypothetical protein
MTNVVQLRPSGHLRLPEDSQGEAFDILSNVSATAEILEALSEEVMGTRLPQIRKERLMQALFDAVTHLEAASDELVAEIEGS